MLNTLLRWIVTVFDLAVLVAAVGAVLTGGGLLWTRPLDAIGDISKRRRQQTTWRGYALILAGLFAATAIMAGCGDNSISNAPSAPINVSGTWSGTATAVGSPAGTGAIRATFAQSGSTVSGTWSATYATAAYNSSGTAIGNLSGSALSLSLNPSVPGTCPYSVTATVNGNVINGTFATLSCSLALSGPLVLSLTSR